MNSCDDCSPECVHVDECIETHYNEMLRRCGINPQETVTASPEAPLNAKEQGLGEGTRFERIRRITGYLVGDVSRWNNGKKAELDDRVSHG